MRFSRGRSVQTYVHESARACTYAYIHRLICVRIHVRMRANPFHFLQCLPGVRLILRRRNAKACCYDGHIACGGAPAPRSAHHARHVGSHTRKGQGIAARGARGVSGSRRPRMRAQVRAVVPRSWLEAHHLRLRGRQQGGRGPDARRRCCQRSSEDSLEQHAARPSTRATVRAPGSRRRTHGGASGSHGSSRRFGRSRERNRPRDHF